MSGCTVNEVPYLEHLIKLNLFPEIKVLVYIRNIAKDAEKLVSSNVPFEKVPKSYCHALSLK